MVERELAYREADELVVVGTMRERRRIMEERSEGFVALPGGFGTLEELVEILVGRMLNRHAKPLVLVNADGFYDDLLRFFDRLVELRFKPGGWRPLMPVVRGVEEVFAVLEREWARGEAADSRVGAGVDPIWR